MSNTHISDNKVSGGQSTQQPKASPSGATDKTIERERKFDEEGGDQPQAASQHAVEQELRQIEQTEGETGQGNADTHRSGAGPDYEEKGAHRSGN